MTAGTFASESHVTPVPPAAGVPWTIWCLIAGSVSGMIGGAWDISWHMSIGRDMFWTPPHILIQLNAVLSGIACAVLILSATFNPQSIKGRSSVKIWGFRGPIGAFVVVWGCMAMLTSAPFDNWWHQAYGLDTKIVSPPHVLLFLGVFAIKAGILMVIAGLTNRTSANVRRTLVWMSVYVGTLCLLQTTTLISEMTRPVDLHSARCYIAIATLVPLVLVGAAWSLARGWACTLITTGYTAIALGLEWILPLFPAQPKLGPVYQIGRAHV